MPKLTEKDYFLPEIYALQSYKTLGSGTTKPMLIQGVCKKTEAKSDYVVKFKSSPRMSPLSSSFELIAAFIGLELDLNIVEPALIEISSEFVETLKGSEGFKYASNSLGINFGCKYVEGFMELASKQHLSENLYKQAEEIFSFDIFISNADRRVDKPNMLTDGEKMLLFDHELAFGFVLDIIKNPKPWIINEADLGWIKNHYFYSYLKGDKHSFSEFIDKFIVLDTNFWNKLHNIIPNEWMSSNFDVIKNNLYSFIKNKEEFKDELNKILL